MTAYILNGAVIFALVVSTVYLLRLNKRLRDMRKAFVEMKGLFETFASQVDRSQVLVSEMKQAGQDVSGALDSKMDEAERLNDQLQVTIARCDNSAARMERVMATGGAPQPPRAAADQDVVHVPLPDRAPPPRRPAEDPAPQHQAGLKRDLSERPAHSPGAKRVFWPKASGGATVPRAKASAPRGNPLVEELFKTMRQRAAE